MHQWVELRSGCGSTRRTQDGVKILDPAGKPIDIGSKEPSQELRCGAIIRLGVRPQWVKSSHKSATLGVCPCPTRSTSLVTELLETSLQKTAREFASLTRVNICQLRNAIVGAAEPPTELAVDILQHHHIRVDVGLVVRVEVSGRELVQHGWALRDDGG
jgi:hypothetical protein